MIFFRLILFDCNGIEVGKFYLSKKKGNTFLRSHIALLSLFKNVVLYVFVKL